MEYNEWARKLKQFGWLWIMIPEWPILSQVELTVRRATEWTPLGENVPAGYRVWLILGAHMKAGPPRVFGVREIKISAPLSLRNQIHGQTFGHDIVYIVIGHTPPYPGTQDLTIYKRPYFVNDFRSFLDR
jgi:hypothetical protein